MSIGISMREHPHYKLGNRIKAAMLAAGYPNIKKFSDKFSIQYKLPYLTLSQYIQGRRRPPDKKLKILSELLNVNFNWLKTGDGDPIDSASTTKKNQEKRDFIQKTFKENINKLQIIDSDLLTTTLEEVLKIKEKHNLTEKKCAKLIINFYNEASKTNGKTIPHRTTIRTFVKMFEETL